MGAKRTVYGNKGNKINRGKVKAKNKYRCDGCHQDGICVKYLMTSDKPTKLSSLEFRCIYTFFSWILLAYNVSMGISVFTSLIMFSIPLLADYTKFNPDTKIRKAIKNIGMFLSTIWILIGLIGQVGIIQLIKEKNIYYVHVSQNFLLFPNYNFKYSYTFFLVGLSVILTFADKYIFSTEYEKIAQKQLESAS